MSTRRGGDKKKAQKYQNTEGYNNQKWGITDKMSKILDAPVGAVCTRCADKIAWKKKFKKYKTLTRPAACEKCHKRTIRHSYHRLCLDCSREEKCCAMCKEKNKTIIGMPKSRAEQAKLEEEAALKLSRLSERKRRTFLRKQEAEENAEKARIKAQKWADNCGGDACVGCAHCQPDAWRADGSVYESMGNLGLGLDGGDFLGIPEPSAGDSEGDDDDDDGGGLDWENDLSDDDGDGAFLGIPEPSADDGDGEGDDAAAEVDAEAGTSGRTEVLVRATAEVAFATPPVAYMTYSDDAAIGQRAPGIDTVEYLKGDAITPGSGKVSVVTFFAKFAKGDYTTIVGVNKLAVAFPGVSFVGLSIDPDKADAEGFLKKLGTAMPEIYIDSLDVSYPLAWDNGKAVKEAYRKIAGMMSLGASACFVVDGEGTIVWREQFGQGHAPHQGQLGEQIRRTVAGEPLLSNGPKPAEEEEDEEEELDMGGADDYDSDLGF